jgi:hypothetical protein
VAEQEFPPLLFVALNCTHLPDEVLFDFLRNQGRSATAMQGLTGDVILEALKRGRERWPADIPLFVRFSSCLVRSAIPAQLRAAVSAAISGGCQDLIDYLLDYGPLKSLSTVEQLALLRELLDHGCGKYIGGYLTRSEPLKQIEVSDMLAILQRVAASPAPADPASEYLRYAVLPPQAAYFTKEEGLQLAHAAISHGHDGLAGRLLELPVLQSLEDQELYLLLEAAALQASRQVVYKLVGLPFFERLDVTLLLNLLKLLAQQPPTPANGQTEFARLIVSVSQLPVQYGQLLKAAMRSGEAEVFSALTEVKPLAPLPDLQEYQKEAIAGGHELAACGLLRSPEAGKLPGTKLQELHDMALEKGQVVLQQGLAYLLHLQQLAASIKS